MASTNRRSYKGPVEFKSYPTGSSKSTAIECGDLIWWDEANDITVSAADFPWHVDEATTQREFARVFLGVSMDAAAKDKADDIRVAKWTGARYPMSSGTVVKDDFLCPEKASGNALEPQKVQVTTDPLAAIAKALSSGTAQTSVLGEYMSTFDLPRPQGQPSMVKDPGAAGSIGVAGWFNGVCPIVSAAAEARTLPVPTALGQRLRILAKDVAAGIVTITATNGAAPNGRTDFNLQADGEFLEFVAVQSGANLRWRLSADARKPMSKAANYTVVEGDLGRTILVDGGTGVTITLPAPSAARVGEKLVVKNRVDQNLIVAGAAADQIETFNDLDADDVRFATTSEKIGGVFEVEYVSATKVFISSPCKNALTVTT